MIIVCNWVIRAADDKLNCLLHVSRVANYGECVRAGRWSPQQRTSNRRKRASIENPPRVPRASTGLEDDSLRPCWDIGIERDDRTRRRRENLRAGIVEPAWRASRLGCCDEPFAARRLNRARKTHIG